MPSPWKSTPSFSPLRKTDTKQNIKAKVIYGEYFHVMPRDTITLYKAVADKRNPNQMEDELAVRLYKFEKNFKNHRNRELEAMKVTAS